MFSAYAGDARVGRYLAWPIHRSIDETFEFLAFSDAEWARWPAGPYLVFDRHRMALLGSTGLAFESPECASTGYVIAADHWGKGYATEALSGITGIAAAVPVRRLYAVCHPQHATSQRVLHKCGFVQEHRDTDPVVFPNHEIKAPQKVLSFAWQP